MLNTASMFRNKAQQKGEGESNFLFMLLAGAIIVSVLYFVVNWIIETKEARYRRANPPAPRPAPRSVEDVGAYETTVKPFFDAENK